MGGTAKRVGLGVASGGLSEFVQKNPFGTPLPFKNPIRAGAQWGLGLSGDSNQGVPGPFSLNQAQFEGDRSAINSLGEKQYQDTLGAIDTNSEAQQKYAGQTVERMLPGIYEDLNSRHLLNSSALPTEIARNASTAAEDVASQRANSIQQALAGRQGFETGALQRGLSLEDFVNQANVSKSIGAAFAPQAPTGKQNFGTTAQGIGALAPMAKLAIK